MYASTTAACSSGPSLVLIGGRKIDAAVIDRDPVALLPSGIIGFSYFDLVALYQTALGQDVSNLVGSFVPIGVESNFVPARDTTKFFGGVYALQGVDFCAVTQGRFDIAAISRAADARATAPSGAPLVKTRYADTDIYTVGNLGFALVTATTMLSGNETGMRRALDRLARTELTRSVPPWMTDLSSSASAQFTVAADFGAEVGTTVDPTGKTVVTPRASSSPAAPVLNLAAQTLPFLAGLRAVRILGNWASPGVNLAGALTYDTEENAQRGSESLRTLRDINPLMSLWLSFGMGISIPPMQTARSGKDASFTQAIDDRTARALLSLLVSAARH